jgi:sirohydrochlorin ferrochelatase
MRRVVLFDNGSLAPASTLQLRRIARELSTRLKCEVTPASLAHSDKILPDELGAEPALLLDAAIERVVADGASEVVAAPLFIGPSYAITRHVPSVIDRWRKRAPHVKFVQAAPLFESGEQRLGEILAEHVNREIRGDVRARVAVVDHGSPSRAVTDVRDAVAEQVRIQLGDRAREVTGCSMERREGTEFDFNEPTLEHLLGRSEWRTGPLVMAMLFIAPGRHAGPDGDVARLVRAARGSDSEVRFTPLLGSHPRLIGILADRVLAAFKNRSGSV